MDTKEKFEEISKDYGMSLYQLNEVCIESSKEVLLGESKVTTSDVLVFFRNGKKLFSNVRIQLCYSSELDNYILVFNLK